MAAHAIRHRPKPSIVMREKRILVDRSDASAIGATDGSEKDIGKSHAAEYITPELYKSWPDFRGLSA
jgi:hypothetical protein